MHEPKEKLLRILKRHVPETAATYCLQLWEQQPFNFKVTRQRQSKLGDYRYDPLHKTHTITINHDLNPYAFLITYLHEYAHLSTTTHYGKKVPPHGKEWKSTFQNIVRPVLSVTIFPPSILEPLRAHMQHPAASTYRDAALVRALRVFDPSQEDEITLEELEEGTVFAFRGNLYKKLQTRRTRVLCQRAGAARRYLISKTAIVSVISKTQTGSETKKNIENP